MHVKFRWLMTSDLRDVVHIERASFPRPWTETDFRVTVKHKNHVGIVATHFDRVIGYCIYDLRKTEVQIINFAVCTSVRRRRVGAKMVNHMRRKLSEQRRTHLIANVSESNLSAQLFFRAQDFTAVRTLRDYYESEDDGERDAYMMVYNVSQRISPQLLKNRIAKYLETD